MNEYVLVTLIDDTKALLNMRDVTIIKHVMTSAYNGTEVCYSENNYLYIKETPEEVYAKIFPKKDF